jgi:hypothetical protein
VGPRSAGPGKFVVRDVLVEDVLQGDVEDLGGAFDVVVAMGADAFGYARRAVFVFRSAGEPARTRTENLVIKSHLLCH